MSVFVRRNVPLLLTFCLGIWMIYDTFFSIGKPGTSAIGAELTAGAAIIAVMMLWVGSFMMVRSEIVFFQRDRKEGKTLRAYLHLYAHGLTALFVIMGFVYGQKSPQYEWWLNHWSTPGEATVYSTLFFTVLGALWRSFRVRTATGFCIAAGGFVVLLGNSSMLQALFPPLRVLSQFWVLEGINSASLKAMMIGAALGVITITLRTIFGKETAYMGIALEET
jgi:hypothetical protein